MQSLYAPLQAQVVQWLTKPGATVRAGDVVLILEAMKMEHEIRATGDGRVKELLFAPGELVNEGDLLLISERLAQAARGLEAENTINSVPPTEGPRGDLQRVRERHAFTQDAGRPEAVAKRHAQGLRTARENMADLCDADSFVEYGALAVAAQRSRRTEADLIQNTPADGMVTGLGRVNGMQIVALSYDATVLAGTQGIRNHQKTDRMLGVALQNKLPVVLFAEGGGGRPGDVDMPIVAGLHVATFAS